MLTYGWKQRRTGLLCNAMKNHALQQRRGAGAVPLSPSWQVCSVTWQLSISMINAVVLGLPVTKLKSVLLWYFKVKWMNEPHRPLKTIWSEALSLTHADVSSRYLNHQAMLSFVFIKPDSLSFKTKRATVIVMLILVYFWTSLAHPHPVTQTLRSRQEAAGRCPLSFSSKITKRYLK